MKGEPASRELLRTEGFSNKTCEIQPDHYPHATRASIKPYANACPFTPIKWSCFRASYFVTVLIERVSSEQGIVTVSPGLVTGTVL